MPALALTVNTEIEVFIAEYEKKTGQSRSASIRDLLKKAIKENSKVKPNKSTATRVLRSSVSGPEHSYFYGEAFNKGYEDNEQQWLAGILTRYIFNGFLKAESSNRVVKPRLTSDYTATVEKLFNMHTVGLDGRVEQKKFVSILLKAVHTNKIVMAEASTGVGKSIALLLTAIEAVKKNQRTVVAAPTLQVLRQLVSQYSEMKRKPAHAVLLGRGEFVSKYRIEDLLDNNPDIANAEEVRSWLSAGGTPNDNSCFDVSWLTETLASIAPEFPVHEVRLPRIINDACLTDPGYIAYQYLFHLSGEVPVIFCSHAMIASDINVRGYMLRRDGDDKDQLTADVEEAKKRAVSALLEEYPDGAPEDIVSKAEATAFYNTYTSTKSAMEGVIPGGFDCILVDEAQELEKTIASASSLNVSVYRLYQNAKHMTALGAGSSAKIKKAYKSLIGLRQDSSNKMFSRGGAMHLNVQQLLKAAKGLLATANKKSINGGAAIGELKSQVNELERLNYEVAKKGRLSSISWTPVHRYPRITVGPQSVNHELEVLWGGVASGAVISASLYLPSPHKHYHVARVLNIPSDKLKTAPPIVAAWLTSPVTVYTPEQVMNKLKKPWLRYPFANSTGDNREEEMSVWVKESAKVIKNIATNAAGGTLILGTSYESVDMLYDKLTKTLGARLIRQSKGERFEVTIERYRELYIEGKRPVALTLGRAWTGLDLTDNRSCVLAKDDNMMSDLVILRLPFGLNQSSTHATRKKIKYTVEALESALMFKQGIGRLVRRRSVPKKNIWILDPRISSKLPKDKAITKYHRQILSVYKKFSVLKR